MRSQFRISLLVVAAATLVIMVLMSSSTRLEEKAHAATSTKLKISQFRENGPGGTGGSTARGSQDEFIEIYNNTDVPFLVGTDTDAGATPSNQGGIGVFASAGNGTTNNIVTLVCKIPDGTSIPARGYVLCVNVNGYTLSSLGAVNSTTGGGTNPGPVAITGGGTTSIGNFPIINGTPFAPGTLTCNPTPCTNTGSGALDGVGSSVDIPDDAGLVLINVGENIVGLGNNIPDNGSFGFVATGILFSNIVVYDRVGFAPYGSGAPGGNARPPNSDAFCEGGPTNCLRPVGDASTINHGTVDFYGDSGQYALLRRQSQSTAAPSQTIPRDTENNVDDFLMVAPKPAINIAANNTNFSSGTTFGLVSVLGAAGPHNNVAPPDLLEGTGGGVVSRTFDLSRPFNQLPNAERRYVIDNAGTTVNAGNMATTVQGNNPLGSYLFRFGFRNGSTVTAIGRLRFRIDQLSVPCGSTGTSTASASPGSAEARNLHQTAPNCQGTETTRTAVLKMLNMPTELVARENAGTDTATQIVRGTVIEDTSNTQTLPFPAPPAAGAETAINGGGINNSVVRTGSTQGSLVGEFVTSVPASAATPTAADFFYIAFRMGVVKGGSFRFIFQPEGAAGGGAPPAPFVTPVP